MQNVEWLQHVIFGNTLLIWGTAVGILLLGFLAAWLVRRLILRPLVGRYEARRAEARGEDAQAGATHARTLERQLGFFLNACVVFGATHVPVWPEKAAPIVNGIATVFLVAASVRLLLGLYQSLSSRFLAGNEDDGARVQAVRTVNFIVRVLVWVLALVLVLDNFGVNISTLLAGLGIGGIAIALAAQTLLGDLFSGLVIFFDRPFEVGDFISVGDLSGSVEKIGMKTTRIRSIGGEQLVFPNTDLTSARIRNFKRLQRRRVAFRVGVAYETPTEKLREIPAWVADIVSRQAQATFDRTHFVAYADSSLQYEIVFFIESSDYVVYMDILQHVNLDLKAKFETEGIEFAYPTRTVHVRTDGAASAVQM